MKLRMTLCGTLVFLAGLAAGWFARPALRDSHAVDAAPASSFLAVPDVFQSTGYSCGVSALQSILAYWGIEAREAELFRSLGTTEQDGTSPENITRVARSYGLTARMQEGATVRDIAAALAKREPVIVDIQAWPDKSTGNTRWDNDWEDGHYVIAIGLDEKNLYVEDPSLIGCRGFIPLTEFQSRWHDYEGKPPYSNNSTQRTYFWLAIFIEGKQKPSSSPLCPVN